MYNEEAADHLVRKGLKAEQFPGPGGPSQGVISRVKKAIRRKNDQPQVISRTAEGFSNGDSSSTGD